MSRIGKKPVPVPDKVKVSVNGQEVVVEGGKSKLSITHRPEVAVRVDSAAKTVVVERKSDSREARAVHGLTRALIANMVQGVTEGFSKELEVNGVGWTVRVEGKNVALNVGYADTRKVPIPDGIKVEITQNRIKISGADKQAVGQLAAVIRSQRKPEPYNGKGIKYVDERIIRKQGKAFAGGGA
jgi:large subunit ribosomal protein L6